MEMSLLGYYMLLFIAMSVYWSYTDPRGIKERYSSYLNPKRLVFNTLAAASLVVFIYTTISIRIPRIIPEIILVTAGLIIVHIGLTLAVWAKIEMGHNWGPPVSSGNKYQAKLIKTGPFRLTRNPIYLGLILMLVGIALSFGSYSLFLCILIYLGVIKVVTMEEKNLERQFGNEYLNYCKKIRRFF